MAAKPDAVDYLEMVLWLCFALFLRWTFVKQRVEFDRRSTRIIGEVATLALIAGGALLLIAMATGHAERNP